MKYFQYLILFLVINFGSLALGVILMNNGPQTDWYVLLNKAPWTPPGWVFGAMWSFIMLLFSFYLTGVFSNENSAKVKKAFTIQVILNVSWNYLFFNQHFVLLGLINLLLLDVTLCYFFFSISKKQTRFLLAPYLIWLGIATSLNLYILIYN